MCAGDVQSHLRCLASGRTPAAAMSSIVDIGRLSFSLISARDSQALCYNQAGNQTAMEFATNRPHAG